MLTLHIIPSNTLDPHFISTVFHLILPPPVYPTSPSSPSSSALSLSEYHLQVHLYKWILRSVLKITSGAHPALLSEEQAQPFLTLHTSPSELVTAPQQDHRTYLGPLAPVIELLTNSFGAIHELTDESDYAEQGSYRSKNIDKDVSHLGALCIYNGLSLATLLAPSHNTSPFEVARAEYRALQGFVSFGVYSVHRFINTQV